MKKEKYLQIFNYLLEFSRLRSVPVRNIETSNQYPEILWLNDIPQNDMFDCVTHPNFKIDSDYWLKIYKPKNEPLKPIFPTLPKEFKDWVELETLLTENLTPTLKEQITVKGKIIYLTEHPSIQEAFLQYCNNKWIDDLTIFISDTKRYEEDLDEYEKLNKTFKKLFTLCNKTQQFGEEFELIMGLGLLQYQDINKTQICRHILTAKAEIKIEHSSRESYVIVTPNIDSEIQVETDSIIDLEGQFDANDIIDAEKKLIEYIRTAEIEGEPFNEKIKDALIIFADTFRVDGEFIDELLKSKEFTNRPVICYSPALILRKRNTKSLTAVYEKIISDISNASFDIDINSINDIIGELSDDSFDSSDNEVDIINSESDSTIYFPKKHNEEQIQIVEKTRINKKVLVQGPPGTGKSHTIANLICHLLANGKKVLVTAYTKRALEVLKNQLPEDFQNLTVNLLSGDSSSIQDLEKSVNAINDELSTNSDLNLLITNINSYEKQLYTVKEDIAKTKNQLINVKEKNTRVQRINEDYVGTLSQIAEKLESDITRYSWFEDEVIDLSKIDLIPEIKQFQNITESYNNINIEDFKYDLPNLDFKAIKEIYENHFNFINKFLQEHDNTEPIFNLKLVSSTYEFYKTIEENFKKLEIAYNDIIKLNPPFKTELLISSDSNFHLWTNRLQRGSKLISVYDYEQLVSYDRNIEIEYPSSKNFKQLNNDAQFLLNYLHEGKTLSGIGFNISRNFLPSNVKDRLYFIKDVKVNGIPCDTIESFNRVIEDINIKEDFSELNSLLGKCSTDLFSEKLIYYKEVISEGTMILSLINESRVIKQSIESVSNFQIVEFDLNSLLKQLRIFRYTKIESFFKNLKSQISNDNFHPIFKELKNSIEDLNYNEFDKICCTIIDLVNSKNDFLKYTELKEKLRIQFPILVSQIENAKFHKSLLSEIKYCITFKHALSIVLKSLDENYESSLLRTLINLEIQEEKLISTVASKKAWFSVISSLNNNPLLKRHLQAWVLAVKKIGKTGTGKRALKFRKEAQVQMENCKDSVPCWIMPLYKVAETIIPKQEMFDYVIIDEASQLGADAIFLLYISKKIIIVGDDKQTSPEYVGVDANSMTPHIKRFLYNIPFANYYGTEFSFFDHAKMFCNGMTVLREHFRCMPEIIEFCNKNFYLPDGKGLYPLKQYSENRLQPLISIYCESGYIDGSYSNITNKVEAEAISDKIKEIIIKEEYFKIENGIKIPKSIGVIALQGTRQSELIDNLILKKIGVQEYEKRKIICGNSASFQGDERDIIFLSLITANNHRRQSLTDDNDKRRFNVAVSRAKEQLWLFHSILPDDLSNHEDLRYKLLDHFINFKPQVIPISKILERTMGSQPEPFDSWFEVDIYNDIVNKGYSVIPQYEVARGKYRIDLVIILPNGIKIAIECDGDKFHAAEHFENDMMRQKVLERCGWQFFRVRGAEYYTNRVKSLQQLWTLLDKSYTKIDEKAYQIEPLILSDISSKDFEKEDTSKIKFNQPDLFSKNIDDSLAIDIFQEKDLKNIKISKHVTSKNEILIFTTYFNLLKIHNRGIFNLSELLSDIQYEEGEKPVYITGTNDYAGFMIFGFENGKVSKIPLDGYATLTSRKKLKNSYSANSRLIFSEHFLEEVDLVMCSTINKAIVFNTNQLLPIKNPSASGVQVLHLKDSSKINRIRILSNVKLQDPEYYRKDGLNAIGYFLKQGDIV